MFHANNYIENPFQSTKTPDSITEALKRPCAIHPIIYKRRRRHLVSHPEPFALLLGFVVVDIFITSPRHVVIIKLQDWKIGRLMIKGA